VGGSGRRREGARRERAGRREKANRDGREIILGWYGEAEDRGRWKGAFIDANGST
jgi:hypothetical protein